MQSSEHRQEIRIQSSFIYSISHSNSSTRQLALRAITDQKDLPGEELAIKYGQYSANCTLIYLFGLS
ncbi:unnamed protein product [Caenorhabditis nigoni]